MCYADMIPGFPQNQDVEEWLFRQHGPYRQHNRLKHALWKQILLDMTFDSAGLEVRFQNERREAVVYRDWLMSWAIVGLSGVHTMWNLLLHMQGFTFSTFMLDCGAVCGSLVVLLFLSKWPQLYCKRRTVFLTLLRFFFSLVLCPILIKPLLKDGSMNALMEYSILGSGATICLLLSLGYRLSLPTEIIIQVVSCLFLMIHSQHVCYDTQGVCESNVESYGIISQFLFFGLGLPLVMDGGHFCLLLSGLIGFWGFLIPAFTVCLMEKWSREDFMAQHPRGNLVRHIRFQSHWLFLYFVVLLIGARAINSWMLGYDC
eukprot:TRINITY_DN4535_c3_g1_i1.p1 TRINITY_DN4535_c3_g1~~TRINITY_DN4535_c3_g1_i1.p1  ORF type:complete len:316 (-),score=12.49 TRINITY_DN4535_c3_g1_i1:23-970(-)